MSESAFALTAEFAPVIYGQAELRYVIVSVQPYKGFTRIKHSIVEERTR